MAQPKRVALITGGIGGIGTAICQRLAKDGHRVVANYHPSEQELADAWLVARQAEGLDISLAVGDVSSFEDSQRMVGEVLGQMGTVDVLVNCAGITRDKTFKRMEQAQWEAVINVNLNSVFNVTRQLWEGMLERGFGRIINISSINGQKGQIGQANYSAAKAGIIGFTKALAQEGAAKGITVNVICPGYINTEMVAAMKPEALAKVVATIPVGRLGEADEIARGVLFLVQDPGFMNGSTLTMNGSQYIAG